MSANPVRVLYVCGCGRSGSTLLARMLGRLPGHLSLGELEKFWMYGLKNDHLCSCGRPFSECGFWAPVAAKALGPRRADDIDHILSFRRTLRLRNLVPIASPRFRSRGYARRFTRYLRVWRRVLEAIRDVSGSEVIVDASKAPHLLFVLHHLEGVELRVVHLVRDSRAVAHSHGRKKPALERHGSSRTIKRSGPLKAGLGWVQWNLLAEGYRRYGGNVTRLRYEDLVTDPAVQLRRIARRNGCGPETFGFLHEGRVSLTAGHLLGGNPMRFQQGDLPLRLDDEWMSIMPRRKRLLVTLVTWPLLRAYGYPLSSAAPPPRPDGSG